MISTFALALSLIVQVAVNKSKPFLTLKCDNSRDPRFIRHPVPSHKRLLSIP